MKPPFANHILSYSKLTIIVNSTKREESLKLNIIKAVLRSTYAVMKALQFVIYQKSETISNSLMLDSKEGIPVCRIPLREKTARRYVKCKF